ncbi:MAG: lysylphosphatidylglycerol synthase transmembrane domain-containing protein [Metamycoplasmataceae bacterium]
MELEHKSEYSSDSLIQIEDNNLDFLNFINGRLISKISDESSCINKNNIIKLSDAFYKYLLVNKVENRKILIVPENYKSKVFAFDFFNYLNCHLDNIFILGIDINPRIENVFSYIDESYENVIFFSENEKEMIIKIYDKKGLILDNKNTKLLNKEIEKNINFKSEEKINNDVKQILRSKEIEISSLLQENDENFSFENINSTLIIFNDENKKEVIKDIFNSGNCKLKDYKNLKLKNLSTVKARFGSLIKKYEVIYQQEVSGEHFEIQVKENNKFTFFNYNDLSIMYLYYLNQNGLLNKNQVIIKSKNSSKLLNDIAKKLKIEIIESNDIFEEIRNCEKEILFATNGDNYFYQNNNKNFVSNSIKNFLLFCHISSFIKNQGKTIKDVFLSLYEEFFYERIHIEEESIKPKVLKNFFDIMKTKTEITGIKITKIEEIKIFKKSRTLIIHLLDGTFLFLKYKYAEEILVSFISTKIKNESLNKELIFECISKEKKIFDSFKEYKEDLDFKKIDNKTILKYGFLFVLFGVLLYIIFSFVYSNINNIGSNISKIFLENKTFSYLFPFILLAKFGTLFIWAFIPYRIMRYQGYKVKYLHLVISTIIGVVISLITPFSIGGEIVVYWFLRRKGYPRAPLITNVLLLGLIHQLFVVITSIIFIPYGFNKFSIFLFADNSESIISVIMIFLGLFFNLISVFFMLGIALSSRFKNLISKVFVSFLEWQPLIIIKDTNKLGGNFKYETMKIHEGVKAVFNKFTNFLEIFFYRLIFSFISVEAIFAIVANLKSDLLNDGIFYWDFLVISKFIELANSFSFLPGGLGTGDWLSNVLYDPLFLKNATETFNVLNRIFFTLIPAIISGILLIVVSVGEWRIDKYKKIQNLLNNNLIKKTRLFTRYYRIVWVVSIFIFISLIFIYYMFVFNIF